MCVCIICLYVCSCTHTIAHLWRPEDNFVSLVLSFHLLMDSSDSTQVTTLAWQSAFTDPGCLKEANKNVFVVNTHNNVKLDMITLHSINACYISFSFK